MTIRAGILALCAAQALTACAKSGDRVRFDGNYYPAKLSKLGGDGGQGFVVAVRDPGQGIAGARDAGRFEATRYCIKMFGDSDITWQAGYDPDNGAAVIDDGNLILRGNCVIW